MAKENYTVTTGSKAYSFHDQSTGITVCRGEEVSLSPRQYLSTKIQRAIAAGHLILVQEKSQIKKYTDFDIRRLNKKAEAQFKKGMTVEKASKGYSLEELKLVAKLHNIEAEENDTVETLMKAIFDDFDSSADE